MGPLLSTPQKQFLQEQILFKVCASYYWNRSVDQGLTGDLTDLNSLRLMRVALKLAMEARYRRIQRDARANINLIFVTAHRTRGRMRCWQHLISAREEQPWEIFLCLRFIPKGYRCIEGTRTSQALMTRGHWQNIFTLDAQALRRITLQSICVRHNQGRAAWRDQRGQSRHRCQHFLSFSHSTRNDAQRHEEDSCCKEAIIHVGHGI